MSAWDVAGAVVWTPLATLMVFVAGHALNGWTDALYQQRPDRDLGHMASVVGVMLACLLASGYCIARLFGAHA